MTTITADPASHALLVAEGSRDVPDWARTTFMVATLLLVWVHLDPFHDLTSVSNIEPSDRGSLATQLSFSCLGIVVLALLRRLGLAPLRALATVPILLTLGWLLVSVGASVSPGLSLRRVILLGIATMAAAAVPLVARSVSHFANVLAATALGVVAVCFASLVLVPDLAMHTALDLREPEHAGAWRGLFSHKNEAGALMVVFVFVGLLAMQAGNRMLGIALAVLSTLFLAGTQSKTSAALFPAVIVATSLCSWLRGTLARALLLLAPLVLLLLVSVGSLFLPPVKTLVSSLTQDATFTGRTDIWEFAAESILKKPFTGWGFGAFWKTEATIYGGSEPLTWVNQADQAHNAYLDIALFMGLPGLAFALLAYVVGPFRDIQAAAGGEAPSPLALFFMRLWLFGLLAAAFESILFDATSAIFFMFVMAVCGLRFLATAQAVRA